MSSNTERNAVTSIAYLNGRTAHYDDAAMYGGIADPGRHQVFDQHGRCPHQDGVRRPDTGAQIGCSRSRQAADQHGWTSRR